MNDFATDRATRPRRTIPIRALIPNAVTVLALCFGLTGVRMGIAGEWEKAVAAVIVAGVLDGIDGRIARLLKGTSRFGAELDSLSDVTAFGVAPALIIYLWSLQHLPGVGWIFALSHAVCCALRLARFNASLDVDNLPHKKAGFLTGIPAPVAAAMTLSPLILDLWLGRDVPGSEMFRNPAITAPVTVGVAFLMVSALPTYSWKLVRVKPAKRLFALVAVGLFAGALFSAPWMTLSLLTLSYALTLPFALRSYRRIRQLGAASPVVTVPDVPALSPTTQASASSD